MKLTVATEQRFFAHNGQYYSHAAADYSFWQRYLSVFSEVNVVARVIEVVKAPVNTVRADGDGVTFTRLPIFVGPLAATVRLPKLLMATRSVSFQNAGYILRVPGAIGTLISMWLTLRKWPYSLEVVGDPYDSLNRMAISRWWAPLLQFFAVQSLKRQCRQADATSYVTRTTLQKRYPPGGVYVTHYSSIDLSDELFDFPNSCGSQKPNDRNLITNTRKIIFVGTLSQRYKGLHVLLKAIRECIDQGHNILLEVLGDGLYRADYIKMAERLGLEDRVSFVGYVRPGKEVMLHLCKAQLFVLPSLMEGLPRALIEAMACGLPCIGTNIGGVPELLPPEDLVPVNDSSALAKKIIGTINDEERLRQMSRRNKQIAGQYRSGHLKKRRDEFYRHTYDVALRHMQMKSDDS